VVDTFLFGEEDPELTDDASLLELAIVDSTGTLELVAFLESELTIRVSDGEMTAENLDSIRRISDYSPL
jgi:acyl carrier protein